MKRRPLLAAILGVCMLPIVGFSQASQVCSGVNRQELKAKVWDSIGFPLRIDRQSFCDRTEIEFNDGWQQIRPSVFRCSAFLTAANDTVGKLRFFFETRLGSEGAHELISVGAHYMRGFVPFVYRVDRRKIADDLIGDNSLRLAMDLALKMRGRIKEDSNKNCNVDVPLPMVDDVELVAGSGFRSPEDIVRCLQRKRPFRSARNGVDHRYRALVEFRIESTGRVSAANVISSSSGDKLIDQRLAEDALYMKFPSIDSGAVSVRYLIDRRRLCRE